MDMQIQPFSKIDAELAELAERNAMLHFDYEDPKDNKAARSHIYGLRKHKSRVAEIHKEAKADALEYTRHLDSEKRRITGELDEMIDVHAKPIKEIEDREKRKVLAELEEKRLAKEAEEKRAREEFEAKRLEQEAKERELREREEAINRKEREEQIRKEAAEKAKVEAEKKAKAKLEWLKREAEEKLKREQAEKDAAEKAEAERMANEEHRVNVRNEVLGELSRQGIDGSSAMKLIDAIEAGETSRLFINWK